MKICKRRLWHYRQPALFFMGILLSLALWAALQLFWGYSFVRAQASPSSPESDWSQFTLPQPQIHPLPEQLQQWQDPDDRGDYFSDIKATPVGYLIWSAFPVKVYLALGDLDPGGAVPLTDAASPTPIAPSAEKSQRWITAVTQAVQDWMAYFPLELVDTADQADITILQSAPPLQGFNPSTENSTPGSSGSENPNSTTAGSSSSSVMNRLPRVRSAETHFQFFVDRPAQSAPILAHRFTIHLTPNQTPDYIRATARHELGHALGIWGHSPVETDALYFSQVRYPPAISARDVNTLKRIYQQPTLLGWELKAAK